jgi:penicillin-insensitive murein endopeptidase
MIKPSLDQLRNTKVFLTLRIRKQMPLIVSVLTLCMPCPADASTRYGSIGNGRLSNGVQLPSQGDNFVAYSVPGVELGRTYVHGLVRQAVLDSYANVRKTMPDKIYVYDETGFSYGGPIRSHRTHQAGLSIDFMVPILNNENLSVRLPSTPLNKFGYELEFDEQGHIPGFRIDFDAMAEHLYQISIVAHQHGIAIKRVIFDQHLMERLFSNSRHGAELRGTMPFMKGCPCIRHDEHYHIDFRISCPPLREYRGK